MLGGVELVGVRRIGRAAAGDEGRPVRVAQNAQRVAQLDDALLVSGPVAAAASRSLACASTQSVHQRAAWAGHKRLCTARAAVETLCRELAQQ